MAVAQTGFNPNQVVRVEGRPDLAPKVEREPEDDARRRQQVRQRLEELVGRLAAMALEQVTKKNTIEQRWLEDLRQYHGRYDASTEAALKANEKSRLYVNMTRPKTHAWEARLSDMLFPADDRNWGIQATPVPELQQAVDANKPPVDQTLGQNGPQPIPPKSPEATQAQTEIDQAAKAAKSMAKEIDDQLKEAKYDAAMREVLHLACKLGSGVSKGPTLTSRTRRKWTQVPGELDENGNPGPPVYTLGQVPDPRPDITQVDPWSFFPDMSATKMEHAGFCFERHLYNAKEVRKLAKQPGFDKSELRKLLQESPQEGYPTYITQLREITGAGQDTLKERYHVWEYHGPIEHEDFEAILESSGEGELIEQYDPLDEINVIVWFCQGHLLKFGEQPMESGDMLYSVFAFERDDTSMFGYGVPYLMRDSQKAINGAWRMTMDNAGLSAGPQVVIDTSAIEPADGSWTLTARKVWQKKKGSTPGNKPFEVFNIPNNQEELVRIIEMARRFADDETNLPVIEQRGDDQASHVTRTAMGMAMLMNAVNVVFRRVVKNFDDEMTVPNITRMYDWNMQFSKNQTIKGDFEVDARGSSVLLVREIQAQNLMLMASNFTDHPVLGKITKAAPLYRKLIEAFMLSPNEIVMTDDEIAAEAEKEAQNPQRDPETAKLEAQLQITQIESDTRLQIAEIERQTKLMTLAETNNMTVAKLQTMLGIKQIETDSKERIMAAEVGVEQRLAAQGNTGGSGGYISLGGGS